MVGREKVSLSPARIAAPGLPWPGARAYAVVAPSLISLATSCGRVGNVPEIPYI